MFESTINIDARKLIGQLDRLEAAFSNGDEPHLQQGLKDASGGYLAFSRARFIGNSRGGGDWAPLSPFTIAERARKQSPGRKASKGERESVHCSRS